MGVLKNRAISFRAIILGILLSFLSMISCVIAMVILLFALKLLGFDTQGLISGIRKLAVVDFGFAIKLLFVFLCGYLSGHFAKKEKVLHGVIAGLILICTNLFFRGFRHPADIPAWHGVVDYVLMVPATALGGYIAMRRETKRAGR